MTLNIEITGRCDNGTQFCYMNTEVCQGQKTAAVFAGVVVMMKI